MPFVKLDAGILDSSLWAEAPEIRVVFITILAMTRPHGVCEATAPGIARRANLPLKLVRTALSTLEAPDPDSRSAEDQGRRLVRVDGGYRVVNYTKYRDKDHSATERKRRQRQRSRRDTVTSRRDIVTVTQGEGEAETEAYPERGEGGGRGGQGENQPPARVSRAETEARDRAARELLSQCQGMAKELGWSVSQVVRRVSTIPSGNGHPEKSFDDPRKPGISLGWIEASLAALREVRVNLTRPPPL
jgi:hypothetical protein